MPLPAPVFDAPIALSRRGCLPGRTLLALAIGASLTLAGGGILFAQPRGARPVGGAASAGPAGEGNNPLWVSATPLDDGRQLLLVIDPQTKSAAVYHVDGPSGSLTLRSTRNITWDLLVPEYNAQEPRPATLRKMLDVGAEGVPAGQTRP